MFYTYTKIKPMSRSNKMGITILTIRMTFCDDPVAGPAVIETEIKRIRYFKYG